LLDCGGLWKRKRAKRKKLKLRKGINCYGEGVNDKQ